MAKEVLWDSQAAGRIEAAKLDKKYAKHSDHFEALADAAWKSLQGINQSPGLLKHDDLYDVLSPVLARDGTTLKIFDECKLAKPLARGWAQWHAWFTHYVVEQYMEGLINGGK